MKTVFNNSMVAHIWAQQTQEQGRSNNGQFYFKGPTIYSYRDSWPLAHFHESGLILINTQRVSNTTSRHESYVRGALAYDDSRIVYIDSVRIMERLLEKYTGSDIIANEITELFKIKVDSALVSASKRKKESTRANDINEALNALHTCEKLCKALKQSFPLHDLQEKLKGDSAGIIAAHKKEREELERVRKEAAKTGHDEELQKFRNGEPYNSNKLLKYTQDKYMRIKGESIETSGGAEFPIAHALKAFKLICAIKERGESYRPDKTIHLGHFKIDMINKNGDVKAGCHYVKWSEIESCAIALGIYP